jgi:peptidyl-prolyl cis-trans isomerase SurA
MNRQPARLLLAPLLLGLAGALCAHLAVAQAAAPAAPATVAPAAAAPATGAAGSTAPATPSTVAPASATTISGGSSAPRAKATRGQFVDRVAAVVNDGVVLQSELDDEARSVTDRLRAQGVQLPTEKVLREQVLERLVLEEIQAQRAERAGINVSDEQVNAALQDIARRNNVPFDQLPAKLSAEGIVYAGYRANLRKEIARQILRGRDVVQRINITPRELDQYLERQKNAGASSLEYNVSHILVAVAQDAAPDQLATAHKKIEAVLERARMGESFRDLAVSSSDSQTALEGGSLGWLKGSALPTFLAEVVPRMKPGEVSEILQTGSGFHLVRLNESRAGGAPQIVKQVHLRHILLKTNEVQDDATAKQKLTQFRQQAVAGTAEFAVLARANSADPGSAVDGGDLGWATLDTFVPAFSQAADKLKDGEISEPVQTQFGWHIIQMLGRRDFDNTATAEREQAYTQLRDSRVDEATEVWLQQIRDEAYVELRL